MKKGLDGINCQLTNKNFCTIYHHLEIFIFLVD